MRYLFFCIILLAPLYLKSTCIVVFKFGNAIYIVADSKRTFAGLKPSEVICKIHSCNNFYYAVAGHGDSMLDATLKSICAQEKSPEKIISSFSDSMKMKYFERMELEKSDPEYFKTSYQYYLHNNLASVALFYMSDGKPFIDRIYITMRQDPTGKTLIIPHPEFNMPYAMLGVHDHLDTLTRSNLTGIMQKVGGKPLLFVDSLVRLEMQYHSDHIGAPIDQLILDNNGAHWVTAKRDCQD